MPSVILAAQKLSTESYASFESRGYKTLMLARLNEVPVTAFPNGIVLLDILIDIFSQQWQLKT
jgi:hypothetical protein